MKDGQGNLIATDGRLFPPVMLMVGRDRMRGRRAWSFFLAWGLRDDDPRPGESVYRRQWEATFFIHSER